MSSITRQNYQLYFDDYCPLCRRTVYYINKFVKPKSTEYIAISDSDLPDHIRDKALTEMLLVSSSGEYKYGYSTYIKIFKLSTTALRPILIALAIFMGLPFINIIGKVVYMKIANNRLRCSTTNSACGLD